MQKSETVETFRHRLEELISRTGLSRARFAARAGVDRSTLTQLLAEDNMRLPRAEALARIAGRHSSSVDWLLGLSEQDQVAADIVPQLAIEPDASSPADERLKRWHEEARGFKIRYVPATLPDQLKTDALIAYESGRLGEKAADAWSGVARARIAYAKRPDTEIEVCAPLQSFEVFAAGLGIWHGLPLPERLSALRHAVEILESLYPSYRLFLFDGRERFSVPFTVFGPKRVAIYVGDMYFVFTSTEHIRELTRHFDSLILSARIQPNDASAFLRQLIVKMG
ncbi:MAG TPA: helix-turn-helix transcriptional regulator [Aestuariivirgaceae bacterium]|nr:helix-turn-helix transcriptional regulator [Aestuariivirgaceae bacterium]